MTSKMNTCLAFVGVCLFVSVTARRYNPTDSAVQSSLDSPVYSNVDLQPAASGHHGHGRVHIKVYRGPSDGHHAPHGFWVKQPADDHRH